MSIILPLEEAGDLTDVGAVEEMDSFSARSVGGMEGRQRSSRQMSSQMIAEKRKAQPRDQKTKGAFACDKMGRNEVIPL